MSKEKTKKKTLSRQIEKFRERLDHLVENDVDEETRGVLADIDHSLGLIERNIADFKIALEKIGE